MPTAFDPFPPPNARALLALPDDPNDLIRHYTFSEPRPLGHPSSIAGAGQPLGVSAVHLCYMRLSGRDSGRRGEQPFAPLLSLVATFSSEFRRKEKLDHLTAQRDQTRREQPGSNSRPVFRLPVNSPCGTNGLAVPRTWDETHRMADRQGGVVLGRHACQESPPPIDPALPPIDVIERICAEAITHASRRIYASLTGGLDARSISDNSMRLLKSAERSAKVSTASSGSASPPGAPQRPSNLLEHIRAGSKVMEALTLSGRNRNVRSTRKPTPEAGTRSVVRWTAPARPRA